MKKVLYILPVIALLAAACNSQSQQSSKQGTAEQVSSFDLQTKCADRAAKFYSDKGYKDGDGISFDYSNHYNSKLSKCFILIKSYSPAADNLSIDLYDAAEGKHYAEFDGHNNCYVAESITKNPKVCQIDSGNIWIDGGNDTKNPADYHYGFQGLANGPEIGDLNTQIKFMEKIQPFMND